MHSLWSALNRISLIKQIIVGLIIGIAVAMSFPAAAHELALLGVIFVGALKGIAPVLVFVLVASALSRKQENHESKIKDVIILYLIGTFLAAFFAVMISYVFPLTLQLDVSAATNKAPEGIAEVLTTLLKNIVDNPVHALMTGNYIGILGWAVLFGIATRRVSESTKAVLDDCANAVTTCVQWVIRLAPLGIMGLVADSISSNGIEAIIGYAQLLALLVGTMLIFAFVVNPIIVYAKLRRNPYPLVWKCISTSGVTAFFTRSSAANIPVNMALAKELGIDPDTYTVTVPLGATINMSGAAITISIMTLAAVHTLGIAVDFRRLSCSVFCRLSVPAVLPALPAVRCSSFPWPAASSASPMTLPCRSSASASSSASFRTRRKRLSTRRQTSCLRQHADFAKRS